MSDQDKKLEGDPIEVLRKPTPAEIKSQWILEVFERYNNKCSNCGAEYSLHARMIVPEEAGGKYVVENGVVLCRVCEMAASASLHAKTKGRERRPINVWISRALHGKLQNALTERNGFSSMGSLVRSLMQMMVEEQGQFDDLSNYQDQGSDVKINVWVDTEVYDDFKKIVGDQNLTVTDAIKGLIMMYEGEAVRSVQRKVPDA